MKKYALYILILIALVGIFGMAKNTNAQCSDTTYTDPTSCRDNGGAWAPGCYRPDHTRTDYNLLTCSESYDVGFYWVAASGTVTAAPPATSDSTNGLEANLKDCALLTGGFDACLIKVFYYIFYGIPSWLLWFSGHFLNTLVSFSINGDFLSSPFVSQGWAVVRDLSNIFFILILLYVAIQTILGFGHDSKKTVVKVIIMALLINFSMFFSKVVIDSSNLLALIFYNKLEVTTQTTSGQPIPYLPVTKQNEKDISGAMVNAFKPDKYLSEEFFESLKLRSQTVPITYLDAAATVGLALIPGVGWYAAGANVARLAWGAFVPSKEVPLSTMLSIILFSGMVMGFATYCFFVAGWLFLSRMIELAILIIFSPFAFMSSSLPKLSSAEGIGWDEWSSRLLSLSFMAPIFMFFLYLIFLLLNANIFSSSLRAEEAAARPIETIMRFLIPTLIILIVLHKATKKAEKSAGELGAGIVKFASVAGGLALGAGIGVAASTMQGTLGHAGKLIFDNKALTDADTRGSKFARTLRNIGGGHDGKGGMAGSSFDLRKGITGTALRAASSATGFDMGANSTFKMKEGGGYVKDLERREKKEKERIEALKVKESEPEKQKLAELQEEKQDILVARGADKAISDIDDKIKKAEEERVFFEKKKNAIRGSYGSDKEALEDTEYLKNVKGVQDTAKKIQDLKNARSAIKHGGEYEYIDEEGNKQKAYYTHNGKMSKEMADTYLKEEAKASEAITEANNKGNQQIYEAEMAGAKKVSEAIEAKNIIIANAEKANAEAKIKAETTATLAKEAEEKASALDSISPLSLAPEDIAMREQARAQAAKAREEAQKAEEALVNVQEANIKAISEAQKSIEEAEKLKAKNSSIAEEARNVEVRKAKEILGQRKVLADKAREAQRGELGHSLNELDDTLIPDAEKEIKDIDNERVRSAANNLQNEKVLGLMPKFWSKAARRKTAHDIRMGVKAENQNTHEHGGDFAEHFIASLASEVILGHEHDDGKSS